MAFGFVNALVLLILITDPLGNIPLFINALERVSPQRMTRVIIRECAIAFIVLLGAMVAGKPILAVLGLSDDTIQAAGGVLLFFIAIEMIFPGSGAKIKSTPEAGEPLIVPIAVPLVAGPSALAAAMLVAAKDPARMPVWIGALAITILVTMLSLFMATRVKKLVGVPVLSAIERLMGLVLTAVSIDMVLKGVSAYFS